MRKIISIVLLVAFLVATLGGCRDVIMAIEPMYAYDYSQWKTVELENIGSFMVPQTWVFSEEDGIVYFSDRPLGEEGCIIYMAEKSTYLLNDVTEVNPYIGEMQALEGEYGAVFGNSGYYALWNFSLNGETVSKFIVIFDMTVASGGSYCLLVGWDDAVDEDVVMQIAASFRHCFS